MDSFGLFLRYMNDEYKPLPSSIIAEGIDCFGVAGDRGDVAMVGYGAARYALASGNRNEAEKRFSSSSESDFTTPSTFSWR